MSHKNVVILGGYGQVGTAIARRLMRTDEFNAIQISRHQFDIRSIKSIEHILTFCAKPFGPIHTVINCAAMTDVVACERDPQLAFETNAIGAMNVAKVCASESLPMIHFSTDYVFDGAQIPTDGYEEMDRTFPVNAYGASKLAGENLIFNYYRHGLSTLYGAAIMRISHVFSSDYHLKNSVIDKIFNRLASEFTVDMNDNIRFSLTYASDLADAVLAFLTREKYQHGLYHVVNTGSPSIVEIAEFISQYAGFNNTINQINVPNQSSDVRRPQRTFLNTSWFEDQIGFHMPHWTVGVRAHIDYMVANKH